MFYSDLKVFKYSTQQLYSSYDILGKQFYTMTIYLLTVKKSFLTEDKLLLTYYFYDCTYLMIASFGGLIGLCTGFSFLSLAEIFYFFTLRCMLPICRKRKKRNQAGKQVNSTDELVVVQIDE